MPDGPTGLARLPHLIPPLFFIAVVTAIFYLSATSLAEQGAASGTPIKNAALYPRLIAGLLLILAVPQLALELLPRGDTDSFGSSRTKTRPLGQILGAVIAFVAYLLLLPIIGHHTATPLLVAVMLLLFGLRRPTHIIAYSVALSLGCALLFEGIFSVNLPRGLFGLAVSF